MQTTSRPTFAHPLTAIAFTLPSHLRLPRRRSVIARLWAWLMAPIEH